MISIYNNYGAWTVLAGLAVCCIIVAFSLAGIFLLQFLLTQPIRRAERGRLFLDFLAQCQVAGLPLEESIISLSQSRDDSMGIYFHLVAAWLEQGLKLDEALERVPNFLPARILSMVCVGYRLGELDKMIPACRIQWADARSQLMSALNYLLILGLVLTPYGLWVIGLLAVFVFPKFNEIHQSVTGESGTLSIINRFLGPGMVVHCVLMGLLWMFAIAYISGGRWKRWIPFLDEFHCWVPWRRKRLLRDFAATLAILLDAGLPEREAVLLAGECPGNTVFERHALAAIANLKRGVALPEALQPVDDSGEFAWRVANAVNGRLGFSAALSGWFETLDAKAFQKEQAASHWISTGLVLWCGLFVGSIAVAVFSTLVSIIDAGVLW